MRRGNIKGLTADAAKVANQLRETNTTINALYKKYHVGRTTLRRVLLSQMSEAEWQQVSRRLRAGRTYKVMKAAAKITKLWSKDGVPIRRLISKYHCNHSSIIKAIRSKLSRQQFEEIRKKHLSKGNRAHHFKKGHKTWNKGLHYNPGGRSVETRFQKGHLRGQAARLWRPVGTIAIRHDSLFRRQRHRKRRRMDGSLRMGKPRRWIKIKDVGRPQDRWIPYARWLWEKEHGPVPEGRFVVHIDGDQMRDKPSNLMLANCGENLIRNERLNPQMRKTAHALAVKSRKKNTRERKKLEAFYGPVIVVWDCGGCRAEYQQKERPGRCVKCGGCSFEKLKQRQIKKVG